MPEGHTLRRLADDLTGTFGGRVVSASSPQGRFEEEAALLDGGVLAGAESAGKHLFMHFDADPDMGRTVHVHLGLYGKFPIFHREPPPPVGQVRLRLVAADGGADSPDGANDRGSAYADLRGATACELVTPLEQEAILQRLGPDPLREDADPGRAWARITRTHRPIGELLMDQAVLAGVGNVYRAEILFRHRLHPLRPGKTLRRGQFQAMWDDLVVLMADGVRRGRIDTIRAEDFEVVHGRPRRPGDRAAGVYVYRRHEQPCYLCGSRIRTEVLAGRNSFWCPRCQPVFRSRASTA